MEDDWRLTAGNEKLFRGAVFVRKPYTRWSPEWEHDHCAFCWAEFVEEGTPEHTAETTFHEGYSTPGPPRNPQPDYYWVCPRCFRDFQQHLGWTVERAPEDDEP